MPYGAVCAALLPHTMVINVQAFYVQVGQKVEPGPAGLVRLEEIMEATDDR